MTESAILSFHGPRRFLSNFWPCTIPWQGLTYRSTEHAFQAAKTLDYTQRLQISALASPADAKRAGRSLRLRDDWEHVKIEVMRELLWIKFADPCLSAQLMATAPAVLVEGNTWNDKVWGCVLVRGEWQGQNHLGRLLMEIRAWLLLMAPSRFPRCSLCLGYHAPYACPAPLAR